MRSAAIVEIEIPTDRVARLADALVGPQIHLLVFDAAFRNCSALGVKREPLMRPARLRDWRAMASHSAVEIPAPNTAITRCSAGCVSAPNRDPRSKSNYHPAFKFELRIVVGSQPAPVETPSDLRSANELREITKALQGVSIQR